MNQTLTAAENQLRNHWSMWGSDSIVERQGSRWVITQFGDMRPHPVVFKTKRAAVDAGTRLVIALANRERGL